jgi:succinyl-diaminopimelate desuccinylase
MPTSQPPDDTGLVPAEVRAQLMALLSDRLQAGHALITRAQFHRAAEEGYTALERRWARPTCDINGIWGGYQGTGAKTIVPAEAGAKLSFRLVSNQDPDKVGRALETMLRGLCPPGITIKLTSQHGSPGVLVPLGSPYVQAAVRAIESAFGRPPVFTREGGSIPVVTAFHQTLGADTLLVGWGQDDDNAHSPNEKFSLADFHRGIRASAELWQELGRISAK